MHPTQKPVELPIRAITNSTELDPRYVDAIIRRYIETSGKQTVTVERDGVTMTIDEVMEAAAGGDVDA